MAFDNKYSTTTGGPYRPSDGFLKASTSMNGMSTLELAKLKQKQLNPTNSPYLPGYYNDPGATANEDAQAARGHPGSEKPATGGTGGTVGGGGGSSSGSAAQQWLSDVLSGKNLPFNAQVQAQQMSQASDMNAAGENARNGQIDANAAAGGASAHDPSLQGAKASNFARRQTENQQAARDVSERGAAQNYAAQRSAAGELNGDQMQRDSWAQQAAMQREGWQHQQSMADRAGRAGGGQSGGGWGSESRQGGGFAFLPTGRQPPNYNSGGQGGQSSDDYETSLYNASKGSGTAYHSPSERAQDAAHQQRMDQQGQSELDSGWSAEVKNRGQVGQGGMYGTGGTTYGGVDYSQPSGGYQSPPFVAKNAPSGGYSDPSADPVQSGGYGGKAAGKGRGQPSGWSKPSAEDKKANPNVQW